MRRLLTAAAQRRRRRKARGGVAGALLVSALLALAWRPWELATSPINERPRQIPYPESHSASFQEPVRYLSDEELLGLFPDRPVALIGPPQDQRLLVLRTPRQTQSPH